MQRKGVVTAVGRTHLVILFDGGGYVRVKKSSYPSLEEDMRVVVNHDGDQGCQAGATIA